MNIPSAAALLALLTLAPLALAQAPAATPATAPATAAATTLNTEKERIGYALGLQLGQNLKGVELDTAALAAGIRDAASGAKPLLSDKEIEASLMALREQVVGAAGGANQKAGDAFLADNAKKDGIKTTASGLQYKVLKSGAGKSPAAADTVSVNYKGTLISGKEFDASPGTPVSFPVNRVIPGWTEALQLMKEGDKWQLFIPAKLAYGPSGAGPDIGPNEVLIFEVELLEVKPAK